jgi:hypothetical protein
MAFEIKIIKFIHDLDDKNLLALPLELFLST